MKADQKTRVYFKKDILKLVDRYYIGPWVKEKYNLDNFDTDTNLRLTLEYLAKNGYSPDYVLKQLKLQEQLLHDEEIEFVL